MSDVDVVGEITDPAFSQRRQYEFVTVAYRLRRLDESTLRRQLQRLGYHGATLNAEIAHQKELMK